MISAKKAYADWAKIYDSNKNLTRDNERLVGQKVLEDFEFKNILEIGCGTGKNTEWLLQKTERITSVDFSKEMLEEARKKITSDKVVFKEADIKKEWNFADGTYDLITFSLVLEHIEEIHSVFEKAVKFLSPGGKVYICELHPFKHLTGSRARFESENGTEWVESFIHHISEFTSAGFSAGLKISRLDEHFDDNEEKLPRLVSLVFEK